MKLTKTITFANIFVLAALLGGLSGLSLHRAQNMSLYDSSIIDKHVKRDVPLPLPVCVKGFSVTGTGTTVCNGDSSGAQRQATELDCTFPFQYNGVWYETCIQLDKPFLWCSIDSVYSNRYAGCEQQCPLLTRRIMKKEPNQIHSTCLTPNPASTPLFPSDNDIQNILNAHNLIRSQVNPQATDMKQLTWDNSLARVAQGWALNCVFQHDCDSCRLLPNYPYIPIGQNAFASSGVAYDSNYWTTAVNAWGKEIEVYFSQKIKT